MAKPRIHILCRKAMVGVPMFVDGPAVRERFEVTKGPSIVKPKPDMVVCETDHILANSIDQPYAMFVNGFWPSENIKPGRLKLIVRALKGARTIVCSSKFLAGQIRSHFGIANTRTLPAGLWGTDHVEYKVNPDRFKPKTEYRFSKRGHPLIVMSIGLTAEIKWRGVDLFMQAAGDVLKKHDAFVVCQAVPRGRPDVIERWKKDYGLKFISWKRGGEFKFTKGLGDQSWPKLLHRADLFVHPSTWDAWGCVVADAMFAAVPSLVFRGTGADEISDEMIKCDPDDPADIRQWLDVILSSGVDERMQYGAALRAEALWKNEEHRGDIADVLQSIVDGDTK